MISKNTIIFLCCFLFEKVKKKLIIELEEIQIIFLFFRKTKNKKQNYLTESPKNIILTFLQLLGKKYCFILAP